MDSNCDCWFGIIIYFPMNLEISISNCCDDDDLCENQKYENKNLMGKINPI